MSRVHLLVLMASTLASCSNSNSLANLNQSQSKSHIRLLQASDSYFSEIEEELVRSGALGVLLVSEIVKVEGGSDHVTIFHQFGDTPESTARELASKKTPKLGAICIFRYRNEIPMPAAVEPCVMLRERQKQQDHSNQIIENSQRSLEESHQAVSQNLRIVSSQIGAVQETAAETLRVVTEDIENARGF